MKMQKLKKRILLILLIPVAGIVLAGICLVMCMFLFSRPFLVSFTSGDFSRGTSVIVAVDRALLHIDTKTFKTRELALKSDMSSCGWSIRSLSEIRLLEFMEPEEEEDEPADLEHPYAGTWKIDAEGNPGYIFLAYRNNRYEGSIRFPQYAYGVIEPMRNLVITGQKITFIRSAYTSAELKRLGISVPFKQQYSGWFNKAGTYVKGEYIIPGSIRNWSGYHVKEKK